MKRIIFLFWKYSFFYHCYQTKSLIDFFATDCTSVVDKLTIQTKTTDAEKYKNEKEYQLKKADNTNKWTEKKINFNIINSATLYVK